MGSKFSPTNKMKNQAAKALVARETSSHATNNLLIPKKEEGLVVFAG